MRNRALQTHRHEDRKHNIINHKQNYDDNDYGDGGENSYALYPSILPYLTLGE